MSTKDNENLTKQLSNVFKRSVFWSSYQTILAKVINKETYIYELFVLVYAIDAGAANNESGIKNNRKYFFQEEKLKIIMY